MPNPQSWNRFGYVRNNPISFNDPTGHTDSCGDNGGGCSSNYTPPPDPDIDLDSGNDDLQCHNDPDCELNSNHDEGGTGEICYPGMAACQLAKGGYEQNDFLFKILPDYWILSGVIPLCPLGYPVCGPAFSIVLDKYGNVYVAIGGGIGLPITVDIGTGWFLGPNNNNEEFAESFLQGPSVNVSGGAVLGGGVNNNNPFNGPGNEMTIENIAVEAQITTPGVSATITYGWLFYDVGDDTPWIWQGD
jgi:hypothetical protein